MTRRALIATLPPLDGGVRAMLDVSLRLLREIDVDPVVAWYEPYSLSPALSVPAHRLGSRRPAREARRVEGAAAAYAIGSWLPELEFPHNWPTRLWRDLIAQSEIHLVVSGSCLPGLAFARTQTPFLGWIASDWHGDRRDRIRSFPWHRRLVDRLLIRPVTRRLERRILGGGRIVALSQATARELDRVAGGRTVRAVLPQPIDTDRFSPDADAVVPGRVGFVGRFDDPRKNLPLFLEALARARAAGANLVAEVVGATPASGHLEAVDRLGLGDAVVFSGRLEPDEYVLRLRSFDVLALTSHQEGLGIAALEAMASGCPLVATRCGGPEELVVEGVSGFLAGFSAEELARRLGEIVADRALRARLAAGARQIVVDRYTWESVREIFRRELGLHEAERGRGHGRQIHG